MSVPADTATLTGADRDLAIECLELEVASRAQDLSDELADCQTRPTTIALADAASAARRLSDALQLLTRVHPAA